METNDQAALDAVIGRLRAGIACQISHNEAVLLSETIDRIGQLEARLNKSAVVEAELKAQIENEKKENQNLREFLARERRALWDGYAMAVLSGGKTPQMACAEASTMMRLRENKPI